MTLQIHAVSEIGSSDLRRLVVDNLTALLGEGTRLVENMPQIDDCCLATSDTHDGPVLLSFDAVDPQRGLDLLRPRVAVDQVSDVLERVLDDSPVVAKDDVVELAVGTVARDVARVVGAEGEESADQSGPRALAEQGVVAGDEQQVGSVGVAGVRSRDGQHTSQRVDVEAGVAVDEVDASTALDVVVA